MAVGIRRLTACLAAVLTVLLAGCRASGVVEVRSADEVAVDLLIIHDLDGFECATDGIGPDSPLTTTEERDASGRRVCHVVGTVHPERIRPYLNVVQAGELVVVSFNPLGVAPGSDESSGSVFSAFSALDVAVRFPGQVLSTNGEVDGNTAHFRDPKQLTRAYGLRADGLNHPGPAWSVIGPATGFVGGVAVAGLGLVLWRRRRTGAQPSDDGSDDESTDELDLEWTDESDHESTEPSHERADEPDQERAAADAAHFGAPPAPGAAGEDPDAPPNDGPPPAVPPGAGPPPDKPPSDRLAPDEPPRRSPDDSVWAPPADS